MNHWPDVRSRKSSRSSNSNPLTDRTRSREYPQAASTSDIIQNPNLTEQAHLSYDSTHSLPTRHVGLPQVGKAAKRMWRISDPERAKELSGVVELLPGANTSQLRDIKQFLEGKIQSSRNAPGPSFHPPRLVTKPNQISQFSIPQNGGQPQNATSLERPDAAVVTSPSNLTIPANAQWGPHAESVFENDHHPSSSKPDMGCNRVSHSTEGHTRKDRASMPAQKTIYQPMNQIRHYASGPARFQSCQSDEPRQRQNHQQMTSSTRESMDPNITTSTDSNLRSNVSSTTTVSSDSPQSRNGISLTTISSHPRIECSFLNCEKTFSRNYEKLRHEGTKHGDTKYTCLLCVCTTSCASPCPVRYHAEPFQNFRPDKMTEHLAKHHPESPLGQQKQGQQTQKELIPQSWLKPYVQEAGLGWFCANPDCSENLGTWENQNEDLFNNHSCSLWAFPESEGGEEELPDTGRPFAARVVARFKRSSFEKKKTRAIQAEEDDEETSSYDGVTGGKMHAAF
jgi:hypothetical protein